jgi:large subunit ribosomal protein L10
MKVKPKMKKDDKQKLVDDLRSKLGTANALYYTDFTGLNVKRMTELRRRLRRAGVEYVVIKNTLAIRAVNESGLVSQKLKGPTGIVVARDAVAGAKVITEFAKEFDSKPGLKGGLFDGKTIDNEQVKKLASMPSREQLLSQLGASMQAPLGQFVGVLNSVLTTFVGALDALKQQKEAA